MWLRSALCRIRRGEKIVLIPWGDTLEISPPLFDDVWVGRHIHISFEAAVPSGSTDTCFRPQFFIKTFDNDAVAIELELHRMNEDAPVPELIGDLANGLPGEIFISYTQRSPIDIRIAAHYRSFYRDITGREPFLDVVSIQGGAAWKKSIENAIGKTVLFVLIWSKAAAGSEYVKIEYLEALRRKRNGSRMAIVIFCIDPPDQPMTPLPEVLAEIQVYRLPVGDV